DIEAHGACGDHRGDRDVLLVRPHARLDLRQVATVEAVVVPGVRREAERQAVDAERVSAQERRRGVERLGGRAEPVLEPPRLGEDPRIGRSEVAARVVLVAHAGHVFSTYGRLWWHSSSAQIGQTSPGAGAWTSGSSGRSGSLPSLSSVTAPRYTLR